MILQTGPSGMGYMTRAGTACAMNGFSRRTNRLRPERRSQQGNLLTAQTAAKVWRAGDAPTDPMVNGALEKLSEPSYHVGDILTTVRTLAATWHACDGSTFSRTAYPALYTVLGGTTLPNISYSSDTTTYIKMADD